MSRVRTIIVAFVTLAVAAFPLAGASAQQIPSAAHASGQQVSTLHGSAHAGCEKTAQIDQAKVDHGQGHCKHGGCGKCLCFGLTAVLTTAQDAPAAHMPLVKAVRIADNATSLAYIPPSPPPRV